MSNSYSYLPKPPRAWSRVQNSCTYVIPNNTYSSIYIPLTNTTTTLQQANFQDKLQYKGNILQYKCNSSKITKNQKYAQISKGLWCNRTKVFATQTQTYTNPNTTGLTRVNYNDVPFPNEIVGLPNNISGPFQYGIPNPFDCSTNTIQDGGSLICGSYSNPCTGQVIQNGSEQQCYPTYCSDVPGKIMNLCWNPKMQTFFPKTRLTMSNSLNKWPQGYKGFQSAVMPVPPVLSIDSQTCSSVTLSWALNNNICLPISSFNIYKDGALINTVPYPLTSLTIYNLRFFNDTFYVTSISNNLESSPSNSVPFTNQCPLFTSIGQTLIFNGPNYSGIVFEYSTNPQSITFNFSVNNGNILVVGGGGGGGQCSGDGEPGGGGGGGGGIFYVNNFISNIGTYNITVGKSGNGTSLSPSCQPGGNSTISYNSSTIINVTGGGGTFNNSGGASGTGGNYLGGSGAGGLYSPGTLPSPLPKGNDSGLPTITIPTFPSTLLHLSGGAGGGINVVSSGTSEPNGPGGTAGFGNGGTTGGSAPSPNGGSGVNIFSDGGGYGGGGGGTPGFGNPSDNSGNGGAGVVIFWWPN